MMYYFGIKCFKMYLIGVQDSFRMNIKYQCAVFKKNGLKLLMNLYGYVIELYGI